MTVNVELMTWLDRIESHGFDNWTSQRMIDAMPHTFFMGFLPPFLAFLQGRYVDLGFENLGLSPQELRLVMTAFGGSGVCIPGTQWRMRFAYPHSTIEPADGSETATLPAWWKEGVLVLDDQAVPTWIGKRVRADQTTGFNLQGYKDDGEGLSPP